MPTACQVDGLEVRVDAARLLVQCACAKETTQLSHGPSSDSSGCSVWAPCKACMDKTHVQAPSNTSPIETS